MADIIGLTVAICDALLKLGERTTQLIQDAKSFNDVSILSLLNCLRRDDRVSRDAHAMFRMLAGFQTKCAARTRARSC